MLARKFAFVVLATFLTLGGCGDDSGTGTDGGGTDGGGGGNDTGIPNVAGDDQFYVVTFLDVGREDPDGVIPGFDLDGYVTNDPAVDPSECTPAQADYTSPDGTPGVDNQFTLLATTIESTLSVDLAMSISDSIASGSILILIQAGDVGDFTNDGGTQVEILLGELPAGVTAPELGGDGRLAAGQTFDVNQLSIGLAVVSGSIEGGVLRTQPTDIPLSIPFDADTTINLTVRDAILEASISANGMTGGVIGGSLLVDEVLAAITAIPEAAAYESIIESLLTTNADLGNPSMCDAISVGLVFEAVNAVRGMDVTPPPPPDAGMASDGGAATDAGAGADAGV